MPSRAKLLAVLGLSAVCASAVHSSWAAVDDYSALGRQIMAAAGVKGGLIVHLGCGDGVLTAALRISDSYLVQGLDADLASVQRARIEVRDAGLAGPVRLVGPPREMQWVTGLPFSKKHWGPRIDAMVTAGGRLFTVEDETPSVLFNMVDKWVLIARDAFNGAALWRRELPGWARGVWTPAARSDVALPAPEGLVLGAYGEMTGAAGGRNGMRVMVAAGERLFVSLAREAPPSMLDAATGEVLLTYDEPPSPTEMILAGDCLLVGGGGRIVALDPETRAVRWRCDGSDVAAGENRLLLLRGKGASVACVDPGTGNTVWERDCAAAAKALSVDLSDVRVSFSGQPQVGEGIALVPVQTGIKRIETLALDASDGTPLWWHRYHDRPFGRGGGPFIMDAAVRVFGTSVISLDPRTGEPAGEVPAPAIRFAGHHARCYYSRATPRYIIAKERGADFVDITTGEVSWNNWLRGSCHRGLIPANGLVYAGQHSCRCYSEAAVRGLHALAPRRTGGGAISWGSDDRLLRGPAYPEPSEAAPSSGASDPQSWPTYRHDAGRSGATLSRLPDDLKPGWTRRLPGRLTAPVISGGRVFVAAMDGHTLYALDALSGEVLWRFTAGGRIDSPPTVFEGLVLFGSHDGHVYCLRADSGALGWQFRAAPGDRSVGAYGQVESAWPVPGSILVRDDPASGARPCAYFVAGRSSFRALPDVLVADGQSLYVRHLRLDSRLETVEDMEPNFYKSPQLTGENKGGDHKYWDNLLEAPRHAVFNDPAYFHRSYFQNFPGLRLYTTTGLLGGYWHPRAYWSYGQVTGQYLVFRGRRAYAVRQFATAFRDRGANAGDGYVVAAGETAAREERDKLFALRPQAYRWRALIPFRPVAMVLAGDRLILAGPPDPKDPAEALAAIEGRRGGKLGVLAAEAGAEQAALSLDSPPVFDGMAVAGGALYIATMDGSVRAFGAAGG